MMSIKRFKSGSYKNCILQVHHEDGAIYHSAWYCADGTPGDIPSDVIHALHVWHKYADMSPTEFVCRTLSLNEETQTEV